jgi:hypothetical protein
MPTSVMLSSVTLVITDISEEHIASIFRAKTIREPVTTLAPTNNLKEPHFITNQKIAFFIVFAIISLILHSIIRLASIAET